MSFPPPPPQAAPDASSATWRPTGGSAGWISSSLADDDEAFLNDNQANPQSFEDDDEQSPGSSADETKAASSNNNNINNPTLNQFDLNTNSTMSLLSPSSEALPTGIKVDGREARPSAVSSKMSALVEMEGELHRMRAGRKTRDFSRDDDEGEIIK
jgi:hypothetical protein